MIIKKSVVRVGVLVALAIFAALAVSALIAPPAAAAPICAPRLTVEVQIPGEESCTVNVESSVYVANAALCTLSITCHTGDCTTVYQLLPIDGYSDSEVANIDGPSLKVVSHSCSVEPDLCGLWVPDVGDAEEKGLIGTDAPDGSTIWIATAPNDAIVVAVIMYPFAGFDTYQVPEEYRFEHFWFKVDGCGRWHGGQELGFPPSE